MSAELEALAGEVARLREELAEGQRLLIRALAAYALDVPSDMPPRERHLHVVRGGES